MLYLITVNYHSAEFIQSLLTSAIANSAPEHGWVIINNSPEDSQIHTLASDTVHILEAGENLGFGGGCNLGLAWVYERDQSAIAWLINPDARLHPDALAQAIQFCQTHPQLSIIGTLVREPDGQIWFAGGDFSPQDGTILAQTALPDRASAPDYQDTAWVTGCSLILNLAQFSQCPEFDRDYFLYYEDFDFCRRYAAQGHAIAVTSQIQVIHQPSAITSRVPALKVKHSTYSYLLALEKHATPQVLLYRLGRILGHAAKISLREPERAIAIIKGVFHYLVRVSRFAPSHHRESGLSAGKTHRTGHLRP